MSIDDLSQALSQALQQRTDRQVTIKADKEVAFGLFVRVMDLVKAAGGEDWVISANFRSKKADIMLRVIFLASVGLHVLIVSLVSVCVSPQERHISLSEQRFRVEFRKQVIVSPPGQADTLLTSVPRKAMARPQFESQRDISLPLSMVQRRQQPPAPTSQPRFPEHSARIVPNQAVIQPRKIERSPVLEPQDFLAQAQTFPTPAPKPKPTVAPTPEPTPVPTAQSTPVPTQTLPLKPTGMPTRTTAQHSLEQTILPTATAMPSTASSHAQPQEETRSSQEPRGREENLAGQSDQRSDVQPDPGILQRYLQQVVKKINARKTYPRQARSKSWQGTVVMKVRILADGTLRSLNWQLL